MGYSAFENADTGYVHDAAFDEAGWSARVQAASAALGALAESSTSVLAADLAQLDAVVAGTPSAPGESLTVSARDLIGQIGRVCDVNHTPLIVMSEFGG